MPKRKYKTEDEIRRKILKLQEKLARRTNEQEHYCSSEENFNDVPYSETPYTELLPYYCQPEWDTSEAQSPQPTAPCLSTAHSATSRQPSPHSAEVDNQPQPVLQLSPQPVSQLPPQPALPLPQNPGTSGENQPDDLQLDDDILQLLGDAPREETPMGPPIHKDIASRWQNILAKGLTKELKESLTKEYLIPNNCDLLLAPTLNPEVRVALHDPLVKRDTSLLYKQKQLGIALSALAAVTEMVLANETSKQKLLKPLSDACRILCDSHFTETRTRRVISSINAKLKQTLIDSNRDKLLFGENVSEKLKAAKTIQQSGEALKNNPPKPRYNRPNIQSTIANRGNLNFVPQHRKTDTKTNNRRAPAYPQRQMSHNNSTRRHNDRDRDRATTTSRTAGGHHRK
ncbi:uncharacterized protein LOC133529282 [Cydia pomonella]|uniref:uncharacterized protein LOC133529282 n=1 Tax=Cydia pomonella TaxID=82600 RepID=UPI002ADE5D10|nr:uncharacterized protein LOC133529282 [Cydia pomonella]